jgi:SprT protein
MSRNSIKEILIKYLPEKVVDDCAYWIVQKNIHLKITRGRSSKFGDYRPLEKGKGHQITVNHDLNPFSFLITFVHEVAHLETHVKYKFHEPHGKEWKHEFRELLKDFMFKGVFPDDINSALVKYIHNPAASSCSDHDLLRSLRKYDRKAEHIFHLEDLPQDTLFCLHQSKSGYVFKKGHKIRSRFNCLEVKSNRIYFVSPLAEVMRIES